MKTQILLAAGIIATTVLVGCGTPRVGPAKTTLDPMPGVEQHLTYAKRVTTVTGDGPPTITLVEESRSKGQAQFELRDKELEGNTQAAVAQANRPSVDYVPGGYGYGSYGVVGGGNYYPSASSYPNYSSYGGGSSVDTSQGGGTFTPYGATSGASGIIGAPAGFRPYGH